MKKEKMASALIFSVILLLAPTGWYDSSAAERAALNETYAAPDNVGIEILPETVPCSQAPAMFSIPTPAATGERAVKNNTAEIDISNTKDGYVMVRYLKETDKELRVIVNGPDASPYIYRLNPDGKYEVLPFSGGDGYYQVTVYENAFGNKYFAVLGTTQYIKLDDEFAPFIRPNQYVNYNASSKTTGKAAELTKGLSSENDKITAIYDYVVKNISYDRQLAATVQPGYIPDVDKVLKEGKGICFDYAAVTAAMLRSQGIPAKLVVGYTGKAYHAWVSAYSDETGWVDGMIYFDGKNWQLMDPTLASRADSSGRIMKYIGNANNYSAKYFY